MWTKMLVEALENHYSYCLFSLFFLYGMQSQDFTKGDFDHTIELLNI